MPKAPRVSTSPHRALLRMLKVECGMLNSFSHSSSFSLAGGRRACPALKPDAADQVLLKNRAGFAAFSKGRAFHRCLEQDRCAGDREAGTGGASRRRGDALRRVAMPVAQDVSPRLIPLVVSLVPRILLGFSHYLRVSDPRAAGAPSGRDGRTGRASLQRGWWGHPAMRAYGWRGPCMHTGGWLYGSSRRGMRRDMPGGAYHF